MVDIRPIRIPGRWSEGRALDVHTIRNVATGMYQIPSEISYG